MGIKSLAITGEKLSADHVSADEFVQSFGELTAGHTLDQIFNCDETSLYYKMLPGRTLPTTHNDTSERKKKIVPPLTVFCLAIFDQTYFSQNWVVMHMRLTESDS